MVGSLSHSHGSWRFISAALVRKNRVSGKGAFSDPSTQETLAVGDFLLMRHVISRRRKVVSLVTCT